MATKTAFEAFKNLDLASALLGFEAPVRLENSPPRLSELFDADGEVDGHAFAFDIDAALAGEGVRELFDSGYLPKPEAMTRLLAMPHETLGRNYGEFLQAVRRTPPKFPDNFNRSDPAAYVRLRLRSLHGVIHVVTGYDASVLGELAVQSFYLGQFGSPVSTTILAAGIMQLQTSPTQVGDLLEVMAEGFNRGRDSRPVLSVPWEELWTAPVFDVIEIAGLAPRTSQLATLPIAHFNPTERDHPVRDPVVSTPDEPPPAPNDIPGARPRGRSSLVAAFAQLNREASQGYSQASSSQPNGTPEPPTRSPLGIPDDDDDDDDALEPPLAPYPGEDDPDYF